MKRLLMTSCAVLAMTAAAHANWSENFDSYAAGTKLDNVGGWFGWDNVSSAAGTVCNEVWLSSPNSMGVSNTLGSDAIHPFDPITSGSWVFTGHQYIPSGLDDLTYFILNSVYNHGGPYEWAIEMHMDPATGMVNENIHDPNGEHATSIVYDSWVEVRVEFDLDVDAFEAYYNNVMIATGTWTSANYPTLAFANVDLYAPHDEPVYWDDFSLIPAPGVLAMLGIAGLVGTRRRRT